MLTFVVDKNGKPLMPTYNIKKVRKKLKAGTAKIFRHDPFTIQLLYDLPKQDVPYTQPVELCEDTGKEHIGLSIKSEKHEFVHAQFDNLPDEKQRHDDCRKYRKSRRNRKRYRAPRCNNRTATKKKGWLAPTVRHAKDNHITLYKKYSEVCPITSIYLEVGQFDTQALEAIQAGKPLPEGTDYQRGPRYKVDTLREAVFQRDGYTCKVCGASPLKKDSTGKKKKVILHVHHALFWKGDHTDRMSGLLTVCDKCHTSKNHQKGGNLFGLTPKVKNMAGAAFMNQVRWFLYEELGGLCEANGASVHLTYGSVTKRERHSRRIEKTHANDAYCIGRFRPKHKAREVKYKKCRRNNRILEKFYDVVYIDSRDGSKKKGTQIGCNRTNRREPRISAKNDRVFRGKKVSKGRVTIRRSRTQLKPGSLVLYKEQIMTVHGTHTNDGHTRVEFTEKAADGRKSVAISKVTIVKPAVIAAWERIA